MFKSLTAFPLLAFAVAYFVLGVSAGGGDSWLASQALEMPLPSGRVLIVSQGDLAVLFSLLLLFVEIVKAVYTGALSLINHALSVLVLVVCVVLFVTTSSYANAPFLFLTMMTIFDVVAGIVITAVAARRDFGGPSVGH